jgi:hypothetical protein
MLILAVHETPTLTREKYEEVVRRLDQREVADRDAFRPSV